VEHCTLVPSAYIPLWNNVEDGKVFLENTVKTFISPVFGCSFQLKKFLKGFNLDFQKVWILICQSDFTEIDSLISGRGSDSV